MHTRRVWIHLSVLGGGGRVLFESGRLMPNGRIVGNDNDADPARYEPHHELIERGDQVQIYEAIMVDADKRVTTSSQCHWWLTLTFQGPFPRGAPGAGLGASTL